MKIEEEDGCAAAIVLLFVVGIILCMLLTF